MSFDNYHPAINLIYFVSVMVSTVLFRHPWYVAVSFLCAFIYSVKLCGEKEYIFSVPTEMVHSAVSQFADVSIMY